MPDCRDYSGVPTRELVRVYVKYSGAKEPLVAPAPRLFAEGIGLDPSTFQDVLDERYVSTGLKNADLIVEGLGQSMHTLEYHGEIHVVPMRDSKNSASLMATDYLWAAGIDAPSKAEKDALIEKLMADRREYCIPSEKQKARIAAESAASSKRLAAKRAAKLAEEMAEDVA